MNDHDIHGDIASLVAEEHRLFDAASERSLDATEQERLKLVQVELDRYYDLLRQRRAREAFGQDPEAANLRAGATVENYVQ